MSRPPPHPRRGYEPVAHEWAIDDPRAMPRVATFFEESPLGVEVLGWACGVVAGLGPATIRMTRSQVALRRRVAFAWLWRPGLWLPRAEVPVVLSVGTHHPLDSSRFKQVLEPYPQRWMHHLEVHAATELDAEAAGWLAVGYEDAE